MEKNIYNDTATQDQIITWVKDEFNKLNPPKEVKLIIANDNLIKERNRLFLYRFKKRYYYQVVNKLPKFLRWRWLLSFIYAIAETQCLQFKETILAESLNQETDFEDSIIVYPHRFNYTIDSIPDRTKSYEEMVREVIRHEVRHSFQTEEMRLVGINPSVAFSFEAMNFAYGKGPLESDAINSQKGENNVSVNNIIKELKEQMKKKGWL